MKNKKSFSSFFFNYNLPCQQGGSAGLVTVLLLLLNAVIISQEAPQNNFKIGGKIGRTPYNEEVTMELYSQCDFNAIWWQTYPWTKDRLDQMNLSVLNDNGESRADVINHYATGYYSKWEAEQDQVDNRVGVKHGEGQGNFSNWNGVACWSTENLSAPACSLLYGPHYRQEKRYKRWYIEQGWDRFNLHYNVRFRMALYNPNNVTGTEDVCKIMVVYRYAEEYTNGTGAIKQDTFQVKTLKVQNFPQNGNFEDFYFNDTYIYPEKFRPPELGDTDYMYKLEIPTPEPIAYNDTEAGLGIQFCVDWLRNDDLCTLYIDYIEVYDNDGWNVYLERPEEISGLIKEYAANYLTEYPYINYWYVHDEPYTLDAFIPYHVVEQIVLDTVDVPLITEFYPYWTHDGKINGEDFLQQWYDIAQPQKLMIDFYPFSPNYPFRFKDAEELRLRLQKCSELQTGFWYSAQAAGVQQGENGPWLIWRMPSDEEFNSTIMLGLAHGMTGVELFSYTSFWAASDIIVKGIVDNRYLPITPSNLYYHLKDKLIPRLKGKLGNTLMNLNYSGNYLQIKRDDNQESAPPVGMDYLILSPGIPEELIYNYHCGFFDREEHPEDKYFMVTNLITTDERNIRLTVQAPDPYFINYRFRDVEGSFDTTIQASNSLVKQMTYLPGEGYLYQVAPVIKYGGRLLYPESTQPGMILNDDMIIENGAVLTINGVYSSKGNIVVRNGGIINGSNGKIQFVDGKKLIIEGSGSITGTANNKLELEFSEPINEEPIGIMIKANGSLTISNCKIENATIGINSLLNANYLNAQNVDFINCVTHSINITGRTPGMNPTPPPQITGCTMLNSNYGIAISNLPGMLIFDNDLTNTACGIYLSNVTDAQIIGNTIISNREELEGIILLSSGGAIRANLITGHTVALRLANSSPILGSNVITENKFHGLYIADGSQPYMRQGQWVGIPPIMYATSGYNKIFQNGGYEGEGDDNDGSEIYFVNANAEMDKGCNSIYDDREPSPPLVNTVLLMSCPEEMEIEVDARVNYWGSWVDESRFSRNLSVEYIPYSETPCPEPQDGSEGELVRMTSFGDVIDTVYAVDIEIPELTETEEAYAEAEEYFLTGNLPNALQMYEGIISSTVTVEEKYLAYQRKYSIGRLTGQSIEYFNQLSNTFSTLSSNTQDTLSKKILNQLSTLSKVGEQEYEAAIGEFDNIVQQNPNTEEAVYAEIDALTTALLLEEADSTLQKGRLGKYLIKSSADYNQKVDEILRKNFGNGEKETEKEVLPTEYTLYQNYPNPFNPTTTIKYDLPNTSDVSLIIYDILGRKIKELVNTKQQAGRYEVQFDASNLASGVYIYQLNADNPSTGSGQGFISSKKMILIK